MLFYSVYSKLAITEKAASRLNANELKVFYDLYGSMVFNLCCHYLRDYMDAEEVTQDVFLRVFEKAPNFREEASFKTWVYRITVNRCIDRLRQKRRREIFSIFIPIDIPTADYAFHPDLQLESNEAVQSLLKAIDKLSDRQKSALILNKIEGMSVTEVAAVLNLELKATESLIFRGKESLRKILDIQSND
ncbi:MAG: sigma-70 family RNA polymerase sigma factor [Cryomorphaceae bacterium]|nr:sigma-70 family RNA polymerase sigma factor [Cryomorphaceae bacterium]